jgi:membrane-bound lytic murein transglycosylase B
MGLPQFIPSSYRAYAIDFDGDGKRDLWTNVSDAIGSVANYFSVHGWQPGSAVVVPARVDGNAYNDLLYTGLEPGFSLQKLKQQGVSLDTELPADTPGVLLEYEIETGVEYWVGLQNFYVITRYNRSQLYAMAVYQLSQALRAGHDAQGH